MGFAEQNTASNTKDAVAQLKATNAKLDAVVAELKEQNQLLRQLIGASAPT